MSGSSNKFSALVGWVIVILLLASLFWLIPTSFNYLDRLAKDSPAAVGGLATGTLALIGIFVSKIWETRNLVNKDLRDKKIAIYQEMLEFFIILLLGNKDLTQEDKVKVSAQSLVNLTPKVMLWGSDRVVRLWQEFRTNTNTSPSKTMAIFEELALEMRKDIGHKNTSIQEGELLNFFINDVRTGMPSLKEEASKIKQQYR